MTKNSALRLAFKAAMLKISKDTELFDSCFDFLPSDEARQKVIDYINAGKIKAEEEIYDAIKDYFPPYDLDKYIKQATEYMDATEFRRFFRDTLFKITDDIIRIDAHYAAAQSKSVRLEIIDGVNSGKLKTMDDVAKITIKCSPAYKAGLIKIEDEE